MTLGDLIKAVEAGTISEDAVSVAPFCYEQGAGSFDKGYFAVTAYRGSLDAAKALHDALLPGWWFAVQPTGATVGKVETPHDGMVFSCGTDDPARAWLLAILRALEAEGRG